MNHHDERPVGATGDESWSAAEREALRSAFPDEAASGALRTRLAARMREQAGLMAPQSLWSMIGGWRLLGPSLAFGVLLGVSAHLLDPQATAPIEGWELLDAAQLAPVWQEGAD